MKESYAIRIHRIDVADLPELVKAVSPEAAGAVVAALLSCRDERITHVTLTVVRSGFSPLPPVE